MKTPQNPVLSFSEFQLSPELSRAIETLGFDRPTPVQAETLPILLGEPTDFLGLASTGTGKTAAFAIPILENLDPREPGVQALVLCPTRELAKQTADQFNLLARFKKTKALAIYGGAGYAGQLRALKEGVSIVIGTPGRIIDHLERKTLSLEGLRTVVLDEADEMISMGFKEEIEKILSLVNSGDSHQTWLFSATMSKEIRRIADGFLHSPKQVRIASETATAEKVSQECFYVSEQQRPHALENLIDSVDGFYGLVFCQTKALVIELTEQLKKNGYAADCLHGDLDQGARERAMRAFKERIVTIMVCTDVASRGIDVKDLTHVVNFSLPRELDLYIHRIGRTGRGGKAGAAWNLVTPSHQWLVGRIERETRTKMKRGELPTAESLIRGKVRRARDGFDSIRVNQAETVQKIQNSLQESGWLEAVESLSKEEIVAGFLAGSIKMPKTVRAESESGKAPFRSKPKRFEKRRDFSGPRGKPYFRGNTRFDGGYEGAPAPFASPEMTRRQRPKVSFKMPS
jgi:ATP-dependent RNA helicase DeaD